MIENLTCGVCHNFSDAQCDNLLKACSLSNTLSATICHKLIDQTVCIAYTRNIPRYMPGLRILLLSSIRNISLYEGMIHVASFASLVLETVSGVLYEIDGALEWPKCCLVYQVLGMLASLVSDAVIAVSRAVRDTRSKNASHTALVVGKIMKQIGN